jgi:DNA (cytosine-5)-methyltransferase 1
MMMMNSSSKSNWLAEIGVISNAFPVEGTLTHLESGLINTDIQKVSDEFNAEGGNSPFSNTGLMVEGTYWTGKTNAEYFGERTVMEDVLEPTKSVPEEFFISEEELKRDKGWIYQKGAKKVERTNAEGYKYYFSEGGLIFPDPLDGPSRTIITGEGGTSASRFKHVVLKDGRYRRLLPIELERLNMFPDNHTKLDGVTDQKRAFFMGNALVVGVVKKLGNSLLEHISNAKPENAI